MTIPRTVTEVLKDHVTFQLEGLDRMYLNLYVPRLQTDQGVAYFWRFHRGHRFASSALMDPMTKDFLRRLEIFAQAHAIPVITFEKDQRKDEVAQGFLARFFTRSYARVLRAGAAQILPPDWAGGTPLRRAFDQALAAIDDFVASARLTP